MGAMAKHWADPGADADQAIRDTRMTFAESATLVSSRQLPPCH
jgi:hypothetical protein